MPGVTDVVIDRHRRRRARPRRSGSASTPSARCEVSGTPAPVEGESDDDDARRSSRRPSCRSRCRRCRSWPRPSRRVHLHFRSNTALEPNCAVADVRPDRAEIWAGLKSPIVAQADDRREARPAARPGHGPRRRGRRVVRPQAVLRRRARGRRVSKAIGKPVKLMWHRADEPARAASTRWPPRGSGPPTSAGQVLTLRAAAHQRRHRLHATASARSSPRWPRSCRLGSATSASPRRSSC